MITERQAACFQFRASFSPCTILQLSRYDLDALPKQLGEAISRAPNFFLGSPVVIDLEKVNELPDIDFAKLKQILLAAGLVPVGARGGSVSQMEASVTAGLPSIVIGKNTSPKKEPEAEEKTLQTASTPSRPSAKLITTPVRSGMQVYAKDTDLIVTASVSPGAEVLADGHIHVYGALRGRALAGVQGDTTARIFCRTLEAELVSIAGYYLTKEDILSLPVQQDNIVEIYLENEQVTIRRMERG